MTNEPFYAPNLKPVTRQALRGITVWELHKDSETTVCEIRDDTRAGAGADVQLVENGELLLARRSATLDGAKYVAEAFRQDYVRTGWR
jgi:hypothetical protein